MKKIIIIAIATLSTGIVLSSNLKRNEAVIKPVNVEVQNSLQQKNVKTPFNIIARAD